MKSVVEPPLLVVDVVLVLVCIVSLTAMAVKRGCQKLRLSLVAQYFQPAWLKGAGTSDTPGQTKEELSANDTSRHPKVPKIGPSHRCQ